MTEFLRPATLWWEGRFRSQELLRRDPDGTALPVPATPGLTARPFPGTLLPGLLDAHVHSGLADLAVIRAGGIGAVWDLGSVPQAIATVAARAPRHPPTGYPAAAHPAVPALPTVRFAGPFLTAPGGYPSDRAWAAPGSWREVRSPADAVEAVDEARAAGATLIKAVAHTAHTTLPRPALAALVDAAHTHHLPVIMHAEGPGAVAEAVEAGADLLAHTPWTEPLDPGLIRTCATRTEWISTLDIHGWGAPTAEARTAVANLRAFLEAGGRVRYGTDLGNGPLIPGVNPREIRLLQTAGMSPTDILRSMTATGITWIPSGLDLTPTHFADSLATARVLDDSIHPHP